MSTRGGRAVPQEARGFFKKLAALKASLERGAALSTAIFEKNERFLRELAANPLHSPAGVAPDAGNSPAILHGLMSGVAAGPEDGAKHTAPGELPASGLSEDAALDQSKDGARDPIPRVSAAAAAEASAPPHMPGGNDFHALASLRQSRESDILDLLDAALAEEPQEIFKRAGKAAGEQLSFKDLKRAFGNEHNEVVLRALFDDFDADQNGYVSIDEFKTGLQHLKILMACHDILDGVVDSLGLGEIFKRRLAQFVRQRRYEDDKTVPVDAPIDADALAKYLQQAGLESALQSCVRDVQEPLTRELALIQSQNQVPVQEMNDKFVPGTFEGAFGDMAEFWRGITDILGLPAVKLWEAMKLHLCDSADSKEVFHVTNNGGYSSTPLQEWEIVVNPEMDKVYPGGRAGVKLDVFMLAHGAQRRNGGEALDMALDEADVRLIELCRKNGCSGKDMIDSVKGVLLRKAIEALMSVHSLDLAIESLKREEEALGHCADTIKGLHGVKLLGERKLEKVRKELANALDKAPRVLSTGGISFSAVAIKMQHVLSMNMLEALALYARRILMAAQVSEEEVFDCCRLLACAAFESDATHRAQICAHTNVHVSGCECTKESSETQLQIHTQRTRMCWGCVDLHVNVFLECVDLHVDCMEVCGVRARKKNLHSEYALMGCFGVACVRLCLRLSGSVSTRVRFVFVPADLLARISCQALLRRVLT